MVATDLVGDVPNRMFKEADMYPRAALIACLLLAGCGSDKPASNAVQQADRYRQSAADRDLFARDPERQAARTIMLDGCSDAMKRGLAAEGNSAPDTQVADVCACQTDMRTRTLPTERILTGEVGPDDGSCDRWLQPAGSAGARRSAG